MVRSLRIPARMLALVLAFPPALLTNHLALADEAAKADRPSWQDLIVGRDAFALAKSLPEYHKLELLQSVLLPTPGTKRTQVEMVYGEAKQVLPPNLKRPSKLQVYQVTGDACELRIAYRDDAVETATFFHEGVRWHEVSPEIGTPRYSDLVHDLELKTGHLQKWLEAVSLPSNLFPWRHP